ncbi:MAG: bifunctional metallophosphatase/5'-nucleotidase, partial [Candidatus Thorarchaeota archaeon]
MLTSRIRPYPALFLVLNLVLYCLFVNFSFTSQPSHLLGTSDESVDRTNPHETSSLDIVNLTLLYLNDFHGWIEPHDGYGGAATYMGYFREEGYHHDNDSFLILSGGDHNTGPAIATLSKGEAVIDVMNAMNFSAAAIGNHEFDFGFDEMERQKELANFPLLACNIYDEGTTNPANFTVPYVIQEHAGINVGIIGLTTITSVYVEYEQYYDFGDYELALRNYIDDVESEGADIVIVLTHVQPSELVGLASSVDDLGIELFVGGHAEAPQVTYVNDAMIVAAGHYARQYAKIVLSIDNSTKSIVSKTGVLIDNIEGGVTPDSSVQIVVDYWVDRVNATEVITYASSDIYDELPESQIGNLVTDGFLHHFDWSHNFGITNRGGGFRDYFRQGNISLGDVVSVIPFENNLLELTMTGAEILQLLEENHGYYVYSGVRYRYYYDPDLVIHSVGIYENGEFYALSPSRTYKGLMSDFNWWQKHLGLYS